MWPWYSTVTHWNFSRVIFRKEARLILGFFFTVNFFFFFDNNRRSVFWLAVAIKVICRIEAAAIAYALQLRVVCQTGLFGSGFGQVQLKIGKMSGLIRA